MPNIFKNKELNIIVNGVAHSTPMKTLSFSDIVALGFGSTQAGSNTTFTIAYRKGHGKKAEGTIDPEGGSVRSHEGMIFNVTKTDKS